MAPTGESVALTSSGGDGACPTLDWLPGLVTVTVLLTFQAKEAVLAVAAWVSVAVTVTE